MSDGNHTFTNYSGGGNIIVVPETESYSSMWLFLSGKTDFLGFVGFPNLRERKQKFLYSFSVDRIDKS